MSLRYSSRIYLTVVILSFRNVLDFKPMGYVSLTVELAVGSGRKTVVRSISTQLTETIAGKIGAALKLCTTTAGTQQSTQKYN